MDPWYTDPPMLAALGSFLAAVFALATAVVIGVSSKRDREQQREINARTSLRPEEVTKVQRLGCEFWVRNDGPATAWDVQVTWSLPHCLGHVTDVDEPAVRTESKPVLLPGDAFRVKARWPFLGEGAIEGVHVHIAWVEREKHPREIALDVDYVKSKPHSTGW